MQHRMLMLYGFDLMDNVIFSGLPYNAINSCSVAVEKFLILQSPVKTLDPQLDRIALMYRFPIDDAVHIANSTPSIMFTKLFMLIN
ncbi:hypothetical protein T08_7733 [Trichinella sp. T8]|nr:hypothetical protein T08_7733 [Trichinella sp. T8]